MMVYWLPYKQFAESQGYTFFEDEKIILPFGAMTGRETVTKLVVMEKDNHRIIASDTYAPIAYMSNTFMGVYSSFELDRDLTAAVRKRWKINIFNPKNIGDKYLDSKFIVKTNNLPAIRNLLTRDVAEIFLKICDSKIPCKLILQRDYISNLYPKFKNKLVLGVEFNEWIPADRLKELTPQIVNLFSRIVL